MLDLYWSLPTWVSLEVNAKEDVELRNMQVDAERKVGKAKLLLLRLA